MENYRNPEVQILHLLSLKLIVYHSMMKGMRLVHTLFSRMLIVAVCLMPAIAFAGVPIVELRGDDAELGRQHGQLLGDQVRLLQQKYLNVYLRSESLQKTAIEKAKAFEPIISPGYLTEVQSLGEATGIDPHRVMLAQCFLDLGSAVACSTISLPASASADGVARMGRNLDFPGLDIAERNSVVIVYHPKGRNAFAAVSWPGLVGVLSGMNEHGLALANMEVLRTGRPVTGMPYVLLYRSLLENCRTVDEAIALLEKTPRQSANNLMLMDAAGNRAVVEITPEKIAVRKVDENQALISTNHQRGQDALTAGLCRRYDLLKSMSTQQFGSINENSMEKMLAAVSQGRLTLQSMVFEPANRIIWLAAGSDAAKTEFNRIDLKSYFKQ